VITLTEFAAQIGKSKMTVSRACKLGRLATCVIRDDKGRVLGISDPELAKREWAANSDYTDAPQRAPVAVAPAAVESVEAPEEEHSLAGAAARSKHWDAQLKELKYHEAAGELVSAKEVENEVASVFAEVRTKLLGVPTRLRQDNPTMTVEQLAAVESVIREALQALSEQPE
jgi:hypothetical protein